VIAIMSGLQDEIKALVGAMKGTQTAPALDRPIYVGEVEGQKTVVVGSGVGKVRASAFAQFLIDHYRVEQLIVFGLAGALDPGLVIGDIVISRTTVMHDFQVAGVGVNEDIRQSPIAADPALVRLAVRAGRNVAPTKVVRAGTVLTGDAAIASSERRAALRRDFGGDCVEMEGAAAALVCSMNSVPFVIVRAISDLADERAHAQFENTFEQTSKASFAVIQEMLRIMGNPECLQAGDHELNVMQGAATQT
jgi:adenosylhomocysteine nucleosidase